MDVNITMCLSDDGLLFASSELDSKVIGTQFDNLAQTLTFKRPDEFVNAELVLKIESDTWKFEKNLYYANQLVLDYSYTQKLTLYIQAAFLKDGNYLEATNKLFFRFRAGQRINGDSRKVVGTSTNEIPYIFESSDGRFYYHSEKDNLDKRLGGDTSGSGGGIPDAPADGNIYGRQNYQWSAIAPTQTQVIVNDLTTGGVDKSLSAEMGKKLNTTKSDKASITLQNSQKQEVDLPEILSEFSGITNQEKTLGVRFDQNGAVEFVPQVASGSGDISNAVFDSSSKILSIQKEDGTSVSAVIPEADATKFGLMTPSDVEAIADLQSKVASLVEGGVWRATFDTYADLITAYPGLDVSVTNWFVNDYCYVIHDENYDSAGLPETSYIVEVSGETKTLGFRKVESSSGGGGGSVATATNTSLGVVKGDNANTPGKIYVELNGSMSTIGWDDLVTAVAAKMAKIASPVAGNFPTINADGSLQSSSASPTSYLPINSKASDSSLLNGYPDSYFMTADSEIVIPTATNLVLGGIKSTLATENVPGSVKVDPDTAKASINGFQQITSSLVDGEVQIRPDGSMFVNGFSSGGGSGVGYPNYLLKTANPIVSSFGENLWTASENGWLQIVGNHAGSTASALEVTMGVQFASRSTKFVVFCGTGISATGNLFIPVSIGDVLNMRQLTNSPTVSVYFVPNKA